MGQTAVYFALDDPTATSLWNLDGREFLERLFELEEDGQCARLDIGKIWDAMHCTLTGVSASQPIEGNKLSEAIVGVYPKDLDYIELIVVSMIDNEDLCEIVNALQSFDRKSIEQAFDPELLKRCQMYPLGIGEDSVSLIEEMDHALSNLREFFQRADDLGLHVLATIL